MLFKNLRLLFILSLFLLLFINFSPILFPELYPDTAGKINDIVIRLLYAYIGSFIFYYLVVYLKQKKDESNIKEFVSNYIRFMYFNYKYLIGSFQKQSENKIEFPNEEELKILLMNIDPNSEAPLVMGVNHKKADWFELLDHVFDTHHNYLNKLETLIPHLPTELIKLLTKSDFKTNRTMNFVWFRSWQNANNKRYNNLEFIAGTLMGYINSIETLKKYHLKKYGEVNVKK